MGGASGTGATSCHGMPARVAAAATAAAAESGGGEGAAMDARGGMATMGGRGSA